MKLEDRIKAFVQLGKIFQCFEQETPWVDFSCGLTKKEYDLFNELLVKAKIHNGWFTEENVRKSLSGIVSLLTEKNIIEWVSNYSFSMNNTYRVGVIMAGNIPLVGFHDFLCVLISGNSIQAKLSKEDNILLPAVAKLLIRIEPRFESKISFVEKLKDFDAVIATGSDNSARYFESYFGKYPHLIRKNRTSIALINGDESEEELKRFAEDVFVYFGKGCRNVTKILLPKGYDLDKLFQAFYSYKEIINHNKYANNYDYNKAIYLMNKIPVLENGFLMLIENESLHSPLSVLNYHFYDSKEDALLYIKNHQEQIQCIVGGGFVPFGKAQCPSVSNYADGIDTMRFLVAINKETLK